MPCLRCQGHGRVGMLPPVVTHNMVDGEHDDILQHIRRTGLLNQPDQRVKVDVVSCAALRSDPPLARLPPRVLELHIAHLSA